jgi:NADH-quinone oxidoreductase subunit G
VEGPADNMATIYIDNRQYEIDAGRNLLDGCLSLGFDLPYFCWHPALGSVGACRQCAVKQFKDENDKRGRLVMACMTPAAEGTRISIGDSEAVEFRRAIIEGLMQNHPHDCPVCDEGGECHLQDMTVMTGHDYRSYRFDKRTFRNQYLGPFVNHEMNRCIQCYRCVRFYREYAGGEDLQAFGLRDTVFFGRDKDGVLENEFAGNLVEVCPTGVFTDATLKHHYTRKWDMQMAPSICVQCGLGCNISAAERYGMLRRVVNRYNKDINGYFLCDRGRYGYEFVNSSQRIREPIARTNSEKSPPSETVLTSQEAIDRLRQLTTGHRVIGIGSPRASLESNFALRRMCGKDRFFSGIPGHELQLLRLMVNVIQSRGTRTPSLAEIEKSDAVLILGEDLTNIAPRMALAVRQSVRQEPIREIAEPLKIPLWMAHSVRDALNDAKGPLFIATTNETKLDDIATHTYRGAPDDIARLGFAAAHMLDPGAPMPAQLPQEIADSAGEIAKALKKARRPLIISGPSCGSAAVIQAAANAAMAVPGTAALAFTAPECNSLGLALMGAPPLESAFDADGDTLIIVENDLYRRAAAPVIDKFLSKFLHVAAVDCLANRTTAKANLVLPARSFAEGDGTIVNNETRAQRFFQAYIPREPIQESWRWLGPWQNLDEIINELASELSRLAESAHAAPSSSFRIEGSKIPREPHRYSGRTSMLANISVHEPKPPDDPDSALAFSMEGTPKQPPPPLVPFFWAPAWNSIQSVNKFRSEIAGPLRGGAEGVRLIEPGETKKDFFRDIPAAFQIRNGQWLVVPLHHIFSSEELSRYAPSVAELSSGAYLGLNPEDGSVIGAEAELLGNRLPVRIMPQLPKGVAGILAGVPPFEGIELPSWHGITRPA